MSSNGSEVCGKLEVSYRCKTAKALVFTLPELLVERLYIRLFGGGSVTSAESDGVFLQS